VGAADGVAGGAPAHATEEGLRRPPRLQGRMRIIRRGQEGEARSLGRQFSGKEPGQPLIRTKSLRSHSRGIRTLEHVAGSGGSSTKDGSGQDCGRGQRYFTSGNDSLRRWPRIDRARHAARSSRSARSVSRVSTS